MALFGLIGDKPDFGNISEDSFLRERARLKKLKIEQREEALFLETEGEGISERAEFTLGHETDLEDLTDEDRLQRSTGRIEPDTGLIL